MPDTVHPADVHDHWDTYIANGRPPLSPAEDALARAYAPLVIRTQERLYGRYTNADEDEMASNAYLGLLYAIRTYDPAKGGFESWAINTMLNRILDGQRGADWISRNRRKNVKMVTEAKLVLAQQGIAFPTDAEIATEAHLDIDAVEVAHSDAVTSRIGSIDHLAESGDLSIEGVAPVTHGSTVDGLLAVWQIDEGLSAHFWDAVRMLADRPKQILALYVWGGFDYKEIGHVFSVSESRISQIFTDTGKKIRKNLETLATA